MSTKFTLSAWHQVGRNAPSGGVVLVHGAWLGAWVWWPVRRWLRRLGIPHVAVELPSQRRLNAELSDDVAAVQAGVNHLDRPTLVVAHSYGGVPATQAAASNDRICGLVFISGVMAEEGESALGLLADDPDPSRWNRFLLHTALGRALLDRAALSARMRRHSRTRSVPFSLEQSPTAIGWRRVQSTYVVLTHDLLLSAALQRRLAQRASRSVEVRGHHAAVFFQARAIAHIIAQVAARQQGGHRQRM